MSRDSSFVLVPSVFICGYIEFCFSRRLGGSIIILISLVSFVSFVVQEYFHFRVLRVLRGERLALAAEQAPQRISRAAAAFCPVLRFALRRPAAQQTVLKTALQLLLRRVGRH